MFNPLKYLRNRKVGLALGSGGAKGISHIAVIEYLQGMGIPVHMIAGSSIGAVVGALYGAGSMARFKNDLVGMTKKDFLSCFDPVFPRSGLIKGKGFIDFLSSYIPSDMLIEDLSIPTAITATDYNKASSVVFRKGRVLDALRASVSVPGVLLPVRYNDTVLIDGGVANPLPVDIVKGMGAGVIIAVNLHPDVTRKTYGFINLEDKKKPEVIDPRKIEIQDQDESSSEFPGERKGLKWLSTVEKWLGWNRHEQKSKLPSIFEIIAQSVDIMEYTNTMTMLKYNPPTVLIEPALLDMGTLDFTSASRALSEGYEACSRVRSRLNRKVKLWV